MEDTICAVATTIGQSSINVIRISGKDAFIIVNKIFDKNVNKYRSNTINYGHIIDNNKIIDEVLLSIFVAPKTFTRENIVEINTHGGTIVVNKIIELLLNNGCRMAEPGEFLKRAYLNGRIDLTEAEAVSDLIEAKTEKARQNAIKGINRELRNNINNLRSKLVSLLGNIEVNIDYPEYEDIEEITIEKIGEVLSEIYKEINNLVNKSETGLFIKEGINVAIVGKPNVGKSSLLNAIIDKNKAIVTDIKGTTRDIVEESINIDGFIVNFLDTAGIRESSDKVERIGIKRSLDAVKKADIILFVVDSNDFNNEDKKILSKIKNKKVLIVYNKIDKGYTNIESLKKYDFVRLSALKKKNLDDLKSKISQLFKLNEINNDEAYVTNARQISLLKKCELIGKNIEEAVKNNLPIDIIEIDIKKLWDTLGEITGETYKEELLNEIFSRFCLGK